MIVIIDYGMGNLGSIQNMLKKAGYKAEISSNPHQIEEADKIILPGVGSFDRAMSNLDELGLKVLLQKKASDGTPVLGICLGMQLLADSSEEGVLNGLGLIPGKVVKFNISPDLKVPHMGWNVVEYNPASIIFQNFKEWDEARFYFIHSYHYIPQDVAHIDGKTMYGDFFASAVSRNNIFGVQFHPEKSHKFGLQLLKNFIEHT
jgi:glutamine amidotransferase